MRPPPAVGAMSAERARQAGRRVQSLVVQVLVVTVVLVIYLGMGFLVYRGRMTAEPLILLSGVVIGYLARMGRSAL